MSKRINLFCRIVIMSVLFLFLFQIDKSRYLYELSLMHIAKAAEIEDDYEYEDETTEYKITNTKELLKELLNRSKAVEIEDDYEYEDETTEYKTKNPKTLLKELLARYKETRNSSEIYGTYPKTQELHIPSDSYYDISQEHSLLLDIASNVGFAPDRIIEAYHELGIKFPQKTFSELAGYALDEGKVSTMPAEHNEALYAILLSEKAPSPQKAQQVQENMALQAGQQIAVSPVVHNAANHIVNNRMDLLRPNVIGGIASGDGDRNIIKGLWIRGIIGSSEYDGKGASAGYGGNMGGGTVGIDFEIIDNLLLGLAYSNINSKFKYRDARQGDITKANSHVWALYSQGRICNTFLLQGIFSYAHSHVKLKNVRQGFNRTADAKFNGDSFSLEGIVHYLKFNRDIANIQILPYIGVRYSHYREGSYKERGAGVIDQTVENARTDDIFTGLLGMKLTGQKEISPDSYIVPTVYAGLELYSNNKSPKVQAKFAYMDKRIEGRGMMKQPNIGYDLGGGLLYRYRNLEFFLDYNCLLQRRYVSHQGSLSLKLLF